MFDNVKYRRQPSKTPKNYKNIRMNRHNKTISTSTKRNKKLLRTRKNLSMIDTKNSTMQSTNGNKSILSMTPTIALKRFLKYLTDYE